MFFCVWLMLAFSFQFPFPPFFFIFMLLWKVKLNKTFPLKLSVAKFLLSLLLCLPLSLLWPSSFMQYYLPRSGLTERSETSARPILSAVACKWLWARLGCKQNIFSKSKYFCHYTPVSHYLAVLQLIYSCGNIFNRCFIFCALQCT